MNKTNKNKLPFDVLKNIELIKYYDGEFLKGMKEGQFVVTKSLIPIVKDQKELIKYNFDKKDTYWTICQEDIPKQKLLFRYSKGKLMSVTLLVTKNNKLYEVKSDKNYGLIKSRYTIDDKGKFKNYDKCKLIPFTGRYLEWDTEHSNYNRSWMNDRTLTDLLDEGIVNKDYNYTNGVKDGVCKTYYKGECPHHYLDGTGYTNRVDWFESIQFNNGKKEGEYINTKTLERGQILDGKRVGEWIITPPEELKWLIGHSDRYDSNTIRIKCNYINGVPHGKWFGINTKDFFNPNIKQRKYIESIHGWFNEGKSEGSFNMTFWNGEKSVLNGEFKNGKRVGEWVEKNWESINSRHLEFNTNIGIRNTKRTGWYSEFEDKKLSDKEISERFYNYENYRIINNKYDDDSLIENITEFYRNNKLIGVQSQSQYMVGKQLSIDYFLSNKYKQFNKYTQKYIPKEYKDSGLNIVSYGDRDSVSIDFTNQYLFNDDRDNRYLEYGYPHTYIGKDYYDRRKKKEYPNLPKNYRDILEKYGKITQMRIGNHSSFGSVNLNSEDSVLLKSLNGEEFILPLNKYGYEIKDSKEYIEFTSFKEEVRDFIVQKLIKMKEEENIQNDEKDGVKTIELSSFPTD